MVKPGGTGRPRLAISARLAPLPPSRSRNSALPSALPSPKVNTHLPAFTASLAGLLAADFAAGLATVFAAGLAALFFRAFRATGGAAFGRAAADDFDFATIFLDLATALAMTADIRAEGRKMRAIHHVWAVPRKTRRPRLHRYR